MIDNMTVNVLSSQFPISITINNQFQHWMKVWVDVGEWILLRYPSLVEPSICSRFCHLRIGFFIRIQTFEVEDVIQPARVTLPECICLSCQFVAAPLQCKNLLHSMTLKVRSSNYIRNTCQNAGFSIFFPLNFSSNSSWILFKSWEVESMTSQF